MTRKGKTPTKPKNRLRQRRIYSEAFRREKVKEIESGLLSISEASRLYGMSPQTVYRWLYKYSLHYQKGTVVVVEKESEGQKRKELLARISELEAALGRKQLELEYLDRLLSIASKELKVDLKKNFGTKPSGATIRSTEKRATR